MAKTYEALIKAEKEDQIRPDESKVFDSKPHSKPHIPVSFKLPTYIIEEYHRMKHALLGTGPEDELKTILFFSSTEGEGTSTTLINFAITLASEGDKVLLVDANLRNPSLHDAFSVEKKGGLTELVFGNSTLEDVIMEDAIKKTPVNNLFVITSGIPHTNPSSVFESSFLYTLIEQMKAQADWVLFDSPPINSYNDSSTLASKMDGVIMVVQAEKTRWEVAQNAKQRMENGKARVLGVILNKRQMHIPEWAYKML